MYYVIYSPDPYLLARMATDLMCEGIDVLDDWMFDPKEDHPFADNRLPPIKWLVISGKEFYFLNHKGLSRPTRFTLTEKNYLKVLGTIINAKNKEK